MVRSNKEAMKKLIYVTILSIVFMVTEIVGGLISNSIALIGDAAHLGSDALGLAISILALHIAAKHATEKYSYGFHRAEVLGAVISIISIWVMAAGLLYEATERFFNPPDIDAPVMFGTAIISLVFNLI